MATGEDSIDAHETRDPGHGAAPPSGSPRSSRTRAGAAWVGICVAALVLVALIVFMLQNTQPVLISFFTLEASVPLSLALLIAGVGVGIVALIIGSIRIGQLRRRVARRPGR